MIRGVSHDWADEGDLAKAEWFRTLTMVERLEMFDEYFELAVALRPDLLENR